mmetsp:Transcript_11557/g.37842  ORF Transcript_11557/g.37842 Transcript_11557/m.37842 type:complete len:246 (-) Transcript_11557:3205-3942(-)
MRRPTWSVHEPAASSCSVTRRTLRHEGRGRLGRARGLGGTRRMLCFTWATNLVSLAPSTKPCSRFWVQRARPQVTGPARPCDRQRPSRQRLGQRDKEHKGQYYDALHVKNGIVKICLVESQGGIAPPTKRIIFNFAKEVGSPSAVDRTDGTGSLRQRPAPGASPSTTRNSSLAPSCRRVDHDGHDDESRGPRTGRAAQGRDWRLRVHPQVPELRRPRHHRRCVRHRRRPGCTRPSDDERRQAQDD